MAQTQTPPLTLGQQGMPSVLTSGITPPDFSRNNQFAGAPLPQMGVGAPGGNPFSLTPGAAQAASSLMPLMGSPGGQSGLGVSGSSLNNAANKLSSAADKLIAAAEKLNSVSSGPSQSPGAPLPSGAPPLSRPAPGAPPGTPPTSSPGAGPRSMLAFGAQQLFNVGSQAIGSGIQYNRGQQLLSESFTGVTSANRQMRAQRDASLGGGIGAIIGGGVGSFFGPLGTVAGASIGSSLGNLAGDYFGFNNQEELQKDINQSLGQFGQQRFGQTSPISLMNLYSSRQDMTTAEGRNRSIQLSRRAALAGMNESNAGAATGLAQSNLDLAPFTDGVLDTSTLRSQRGLSRRAANQLMTGIGAAGGRTLNEFDVEDATNFMGTFGQAGAGMLGGQIAATNYGGALRGTGFNQLTLARQANAMGMRGNVAANYAAAGSAFFGGRLDTGLGNTPESTQMFERFRATGQRAGISGFEGARSFQRAQSLSGTLAGLEQDVYSRTGVADTARNLAYSEAMSAAGGNINRVGEVLDTQGAEILGNVGQGPLGRAMLRSLTGDRATADALMMNQAVEGPAQQALGLGAKAGEPLNAAAKRENQQAEQFSSQLFNAVTKAMGALASDLGDGATLKDVVMELQNLKKTGNQTAQTMRDTGKTNAKPAQTKAQQLESTKRLQTKFADATD